MNQQQKKDKIIDRVREIYPDDADYTDWLYNPSQFLDGKTPSECLDDDVDLLYDFLAMCIVEW